MKLFNIAFSFLMLLGVVACDPMSDYSDELDRRLNENNDYKIYVSSRNFLSEEIYTKDNPYVISDEDYKECNGTSSYKEFSAYAPIETHMDSVMNLNYGNGNKVVFVEYKYNLGKESGYKQIKDTATIAFVDADLAWVVVPVYEMELLDGEVPHDVEYTLTADDYQKTLNKSHANLNTSDDVQTSLNTVITNNFLIDLNVGDIWKVNYAVYESGSVNNYVAYMEVTIEE